MDIDTLVGYIYFLLPLHLHLTSSITNLSIYIPPPMFSYFLYLLCLYFPTTTIFLVIVPYIFHLLHYPALLTDISHYTHTTYIRFFIPPATISPPPVPLPIISVLCDSFNDHVSNISVISISVTEPSLSPSSLCLHLYLLHQN